MNNPNYSVRFGETVEQCFPTEQTVFPFMYTMVPFENDNWEAVKGAGTQANLTGIGPTVGPLATVSHPVNLEPDYMFKILWIKYTIYSRLATLPPFVNPLYVWYDPVAAWGLDYFDYQLAYGTQLTRFLRSTVSFIGPDGRILYGGKNLDAQANLLGDRLPLPITTVQGYDHGYGDLKSPYLLPRNATIMFELTNTHTIKAFVVGAVIYGMKVRL